MNIYLMQSGEWKLFKDCAANELEKRNITFGARASIGEGASIGARARIGEWARIAKSFDYILIGPVGSREATLTAYKHKKTIWIGMGCFIGTIKDFEERVQKTHGNNQFGKQYEQALKYVREKFEVLA